MTFYNVPDTEQMRRLLHNAQSCNFPRMLCSSHGCPVQCCRVQPSRLAGWLWSFTARRAWMETIKMEAGGGGGVRGGGRERHLCTGVLRADQQVEWCIDRRSHLQSWNDFGIHGKYIFHSQKSDRKLCFDLSEPDLHCCFLGKTKQKVAPGNSS